MIFCACQPWNCLAVSQLEIHTTIKQEHHIFVIILKQIIIACSLWCRNNIFCFVFLLQKDCKKLGRWVRYVLLVLWIWNFCISVNWFYKPKSEIQSMLDFARDVTYYYQCNLNEYMYVAMAAACFTVFILMMNWYSQVEWHRAK